MRASPPRPIADPRSWVALIVTIVLAVIAASRWHWLRWVFGIVLVLALLRAVAFVARARAAMADPEARFSEEEKNGGGQADAA